MNLAELAGQLALADAAERPLLLARHPGLAGVPLAWALKDLYLASSTSDPSRAAGVAAAIGDLASASDHPEVQAVAAWVMGMAVQRIDGQMERALVYLDDAARRFEHLGLHHAAALTQVSTVFALAILGRYDEAQAIGLRARDRLLTHGDQLAAGKIEQNLGNLAWRRDRYAEAEQFYRAALQRFIAVGDEQALARAYNNLAHALTWQYRFRAAATLYDQALERATSAGLVLAQAEIECNIGCQALFQGRYDQALDYLERSRRRYNTLDMRHESATLELDLADVYLELNLLPEALALYARATSVFAELGMRAEQARAHATYGHACLLHGQIEQAQQHLAHAGVLYEAEENRVGRALVTLSEGELRYRQGAYQAAVELTATSEAVLEAAGARGKRLLACWLHGDALRALGQHTQAWPLLEATLRDAEAQRLPQVVQRCYTSLGLLALAMGEAERAEQAFARALEQIEALRAPLPAEAFHTAFIADKLTPYTELLRLCLADPRGQRVDEALSYVERARSRALVEMLSGVRLAHRRPRDEAARELFARVDELREELNWFYSQIYRPSDGDTPLSPAAMDSLHREVHMRETAMAELLRQLQQRGEDSTGLGDAGSSSPTHSLAQLQQDLGADTALVEYFSLDGQLLAFAVTNVGLAVVWPLASEQQVDALVEELRFQIDALRYGTDQLRPYMAQLEARARDCLRQLYELLLAPLVAHLDRQRLVVVPYRSLHYVPFHALYDGHSFVIETYEICYAPSASVLHLSLAQPRRPLRRALLVGVADAQAPRVRDEVLTLANLFADPVVYVDEQATRAVLRAEAPRADIVHLACHGHFRPDNPLFSALRLGDGWLTVRDAYTLELSCELVALSACETGVSAVAPGDELLGLARGFFSAGAPSLLVSLWTVDDESTATLMAAFYTRLRAGDRPAAALRHAQLALLAQQQHPFFWSSFVLFGRW